MNLPKIQPLTPKSALIYGWIVLAVASLAVLLAWVDASVEFYDQVIPYYDSLSYQMGYLNTTQSLEAKGPIGKLIATWQEGRNNVVLYKFFAALFGDFLPYPKAGLYVYLFGIHLLVTWVLFHTVSKLSNSATLALVAVAAWWFTTPFGLLRDGIGDQRIDLSSGSFCLLVAALGLQWVNRPTRWGAVLTGIATALAMLHRPIMAASLGGIGILLFLAARFRHGKIPSGWIVHMLWAATPIAIIALPWLLKHFAYLRTYYLEFNVGVGIGSYWEAVTYNYDRFTYAFGLVSALILLAGVIYATTRKHLDRVSWVTVTLIVAAPLCVLVITKSAGNLYVAQMSLGLPLLWLTSFSTPRANRIGDSWVSLGIAALLVVATVMAAPFRLQHSLAQEQSKARPEVETVINQIAATHPIGKLSGFHDQPVNVLAITSIARDMQIGLSVGSVYYHPYDFGLTAEEALVRDVSRIHSALTQVIEQLKLTQDLLMIPTQETENRLWAGLFSHQMIPELRRLVEGDPSFVLLLKSSPIEGVEFNIYQSNFNPAP